MVISNFKNKPLFGISCLWERIDFIMEFLVPISIMVFLNLFLIFRLLFMATKYVQNKNVKLSQFRIYEGEFPDRLRSARQQFQNMFRNTHFILFVMLTEYFF